ncbi:glycosyltransferase family 2 protein [Wenzhouxiangella marina]|uniref:Glycosyltransferase n=1 Tax=Wenzhouxiangella marina TaxID=1579979 RepID=A0A0K0XW67_9GAMM|nr:glycosyltransferase family 2 protein [Wenzhouxiangella marina]AKS41861.1 Glycosyltransferase [Wenzhouxiangella marina]MBB6086373.1 glycosyltransferase involved in cell wall biosynthesis [Wenzhouxiangella marina]
MSAPSTPELSLIIPCFNEAEGIAGLAAALEPVLASLDADGVELVLVDDGSNDSTHAELLAWRARNPAVHPVRLARNFGKEAAMTCGLHLARGRAVVILDADLQDPPELIPQMLERWRAGADVVLAHRSLRPEDGWFKRVSAAAFYRLMDVLAHNQVPANVGDFRLMDRRVVDALLHLPEKTRFMKGLMNYVGFKVETIDYIRPARYTGSSRWSVWRLWNLALEGITSFSTAPLRAWGYLGVVFALIALAYASWIVLRTLIWGVDVPGYASLATLILFFSGLQMFSIGILGEYLARIFIETKNRPLYVVEQLDGFEPEWIEAQAERVVGNIVLPRQARKS